MSLNRLSTLALATVLGGCATADQVQQLEAKVADLEEKVAAIGTGGKAPKDEKAEKAASELYQKLTKDVTDGNIDGAKKKLAKLKSKYASTTAYRRAKKTEKELEVIGKDAPASLNVEKWLANETSIDFGSNSPTLLVFWEVWCPHCKREVPKMQKVYDTFSPQGLQMVGLTKITRSATDESVDAFIAENNLSYPTAKENGDLSKAFNVSGIPAAAMVKGGKIVWRGHPGRLTDDMIKGWL
jgi:thiol-disulfide isomerase/thioredoxin